jgi:tetratricopeptide (TPR) repeat protein
MFDVIAPAVDAIAASTHDADTARLASWANWSYASSLLVVGRSDEAMARTKDGYARLDATWSDAEKLRVNYAAVLNDRLGALVTAKDYDHALAVYNDNRVACRADKICTDNVGIAYLNRSNDAQNAGDWQTARTALTNCVAELPDDARCRDRLADLESRHRF